jgi:O-antigen ligase
MAAAPSRAPAAAWSRGAPRPIGSVGGPALTQTVPITGEASFLLFCLLTFVVVGRPNDYVQALVPLRLALVMTPLTIMATLLQSPSSAYIALRHTETKMYLAFYLMMCIGLPFAMHRRVSFDQVVTGYSTNIAFFLLFVTHVTTRERLSRIWTVLVTGAVLFSLVGHSQGWTNSGRFYAASGMYDPNDVAYVELALLPFALCILMASASVSRRMLALASILLGMLLALYTGSRGGMLGILTFVLLFVTLRIGRLKAIHKGLLLAALAVAVVLNADKINTERYLTLTNLENDYNLEEGGRWDVWKQGLTILMRRPLTGVGPNNFAMAIGYYRQEQGVLPKWQAPHNSVIQVLVEVGVIGGVLWLILLSSTAKTFWRLRQHDDPSGNRDVAVWGGVLFVGFVAQLVSSVFLTMGYSIFFTLFLAISVSLQQIAAASDGGAATSATTGVRLGARSAVLPARRASFSR